MGHIRNAKRVFPQVTQNAYPLLPMNSVLFWFIKVQKNSSHLFQTLSKCCQNFKILRGAGQRKSNIFALFGTKMTHCTVHNSSHINTMYILQCSESSSLSSVRIFHAGCPDMFVQSFFSKNYFRSIFSHQNHFYCCCVQQITNVLLNRPIDYTTAKLHRVNYEKSAIK